MTIAYVNGEFLPAESAQLSIFDRGLLFADAVYEVAAVVQQRLLDNPAHLTRLRCSLDMIQLPLTLTDETLVAIQQELIARNHLQEGLVYTMITRGPALRQFALPETAKPSVVLFTQPAHILQNPKRDSGIQVITTPDIRWLRRDIKTVALLAQSLAKQQAINSGVDDAWFVQDGVITEGTSNNAFIITHDNVLYTHPKNHYILGGITRQAILDISATLGLAVCEQGFTPEQAYAAKEAFSSSATTLLMPVIQIDGHLIGNGRVGPLCQTIYQRYLEKYIYSNPR